MDSFIGIGIISFLFIGLTLLVYILIKKNIFSSNNESNSKNTNDQKMAKFGKLSKLIDENDQLNKEIKFLEGKNCRLRLKIEEMKKAIESLEEQKNQLQLSEKRLLELRAQKDEALAMVAHDIKNPASTIKNFVELLESYDISSQEQHDIFAGLIETSSRLLKLADEFTHVISEEFESFQLNKNKNNLKDTIESIVKVNRVKANKKDIEIRLYQPELELELEFDDEKIKEVIDNFVGNAIKYSPEKSKVNVITKVVNKNVEVEVTDNGFGLTEDEVAHAFEKGSKFSNKPTGDESSSGLGLWIAKKIVEEHNGKVYVKSKKGFGSTFSFSLPIK